MFLNFPYWNSESRGTTYDSNVPALQQTWQCNNQSFVLERIASSGALGPSS